MASHSWPPRWLSTFSSSRFVDGSSGSLTGASIAASMTPPRPWQPSAPPCARKWTWTNCANSCWRWCRRRCSLPMSRCGCVHLNMKENSGLLGEQLLFLLREDEEGKGFLAHPHFHALSMKGNHDDGKGATRLRETVARRGMRSKAI